MIIFLEGFTLQAGLILALGAQYVFLLETGIQKQHRAISVFICSTCDIILLLLGVLGTASLFQKHPYFQDGTVIGGILFLGLLAFRKFQEAHRTGPLKPQRAHLVLSTTQIALK